MREQDRCFVCRGLCPALRLRIRVTGELDVGGGMPAQPFCRLLSVAVCPRCVPRLAGDLGRRIQGAARGEQSWARRCAPYR
jgi:hypothetical protein